MKKVIKKLFNLQGLWIDSTDWKENGVILKVRSPRNTAKCPFCRKSTKLIHQKRERKIKHGIYMGKIVYLLIKVRRFYCKKRIGSKIHRKYDVPKTPYQRVIESEGISEKTKQQLKKIYYSLNPAQLKKDIDKKLDLLYQSYQLKRKSQKVEPQKKLKPISLTFNLTQSKKFHLPN